ncbi:MAG: hypothetical protein SOY67_02355 [Collinsella sp.]|nr:hypothetical protein [Collinsella sp.]
MAVQTHAHPAIAAGLAGGVGLILPAAAYLATASLDGAHRLVAEAGMPFALGAVAGAGMCAVAMAALAASANARLGNRSEAGEYRFGEDAAPVPEEASDAPAKERAGFFHARPAEDVPVISRALDALSEAEAWAEIDKLLEEDSPVSCDPARSKDIYEIAFAELARGASAAEAAPAAETATAPAVTSSLAALDGAQQTASLAAEREELSDTDAARAAALASLGAVSAPRAAAAPSVSSETIAMAPSSEFAPMAAAVAAAPEEVPMADYTGHEDMWAAALAILEAEAVPASEPVRAASLPAAEEVPAAAPRVRAEEVPATEERVEAIAEGERLTEMHGRINEILGEEVAKMPSQSMRRTSREYLRVIQGGTMAMPRLKAEA